MFGLSDAWTDENYRMLGFGHGIFANSFRRPVMYIRLLRILASLGGERNAT
jgi:hypothetical protein